MNSVGAVGLFIMLAAFLRREVAPLWLTPSVGWSDGWMVRPNNKILQNLLTLKTSYVEIAMRLGFGVCVFFGPPFDFSCLHREVMFSFFSVPLLFFHVCIEMLVGWSLGPHITLTVIFIAICGQIDLKFGGDLYVDLLFQFLLFFFLSSCSNSSSSFSSP
jgi:hypothetical protein